MVLIALIVILYPAFILPGIAITIFVLIAQTQPVKHILLFIVFLLVAFSGDLSSELRNIINIIAFVFLVYYFIQQRGLDYTAYPVLINPLVIFISGVILSMVISSLFSSSVFTGLTETCRQAVFFIIWYILFSSISEKKDIFNFAHVLIASGTVLGIIILYHFVTTEVSIITLISEGLLHEGGIFNNPAAAGGVFAVSIPLTISLLFAYSDNWKVKYLLSSLIFIQGAGLVLTNSRAAVIASLVSTLVLLFILKRKLLFGSLAAIAAVVILIMLFFPFILELIQLYFRTGRILENTRYLLWDMSAGIIADNPVWGTGPGLFKSQMYNHLPVMLGTWSAEQIKWVYESSGLGESHNFYLFRTAELGIPGLLSAVALPVIFISYSIKTMKTYYSNKRLFSLVAGIFSLGIGLFARSFLEATGLLSHGWISRDLPFWICFSGIIYLNKKEHNYQV
jgi:O-antigen ligase